MEPTAKEVGLSDYFVSLRRRRAVLMFVGLPIVMGALILAFSLPKSYSSMAEFRFEKAALAAEVPQGEERGAQDRYVDEYVNKLKESVLGGNNLSKLSDDLKVYPELKDNPGASMDRLRKNVHVDLIVNKILDPETGHQKDVNSGFRVSFDASTPVAAQKVAQWLANQFVLVARQFRHDKDAASSTFLLSEADQYASQITAAESKLADFKQKHISELPESQQSNLVTKERTEQELNGVEQEIRTLEQNQVFLQSQLSETQANPDNETLRALQEEYARKKITYDDNHPDIIALRRQIEAMQRGGSPDGDTLQQQLDTQKAILNETRQRYSEDHPDVKRIERTIATLQARIAAGEKADKKVTPSNPIVVQLQTQVRSNQNQMASLERRRNELRDKLTQLQGQQALSPQVEKDYELINRDLTLARDKYGELLKRKMEADFGAAAALSGDEDEFRLVQAPGKPSAPSKPSRVGIFMIGALLATVLSLAVALAAEALDSTVRGSRDLASVLNLTPLAVIPEIRNSVYRRHRARQAMAMAVSLALVVPALYFIIRLVVR